MSNSPTLVVLGASGDLAARLLFPALLSLEHRERLEGLRVIGYARQDWTNEQFHANLRAAIDRDGTDFDEKYFERFIDRIDFHGGDLSVDSLRVLNGVLDGPAIFYLALPPGVFADAAETIAQAGLADETNGWRRLVIEKPFGTDLTTAHSRSTSNCKKVGAKIRSSASIISSAKRPCRTFLCSDSRTGSSSRCSAPITSTKSRSPSPKRSASKDGRGTTTASVLSAT